MGAELIPPADLEIDADEQNLPGYRDLTGDDELVRPSSDRSVGRLRYDRHDGAKWRRTVIPIRSARPARPAQEQSRYRESRAELRHGIACVQVRLQRLLGAPRHDPGNTTSGVVPRDDRDRRNGEPDHGVCERALD